MDDSIVATSGDQVHRLNDERPAGLIPKSSGAVAASNVDVTWAVFQKLLWRLKIVVVFLCVFIGCQHIFLVLWVFI